MSTKTITLDFYNHNIVYLKAKQDDTGRQVKVTCTDYGKKVNLDPSKHSAIVKYKKSDGNFAFNEASVLDTGEVLIELTAQMLAVTGKQMLELAVVRSEGLAADSLSNVQGFEDLGVSIISTMPLYINVVKSVLDEADVTSLSEFSVLTSAITKMTAVDKYMKNLEAELESNEQNRKDAETLRIEAESNRVDAEKSRVKAEKSRVDAEKSRVNAESSRVSAEKSRVKVEESRVDAESSRVSAETSRTSTFNTLKTELENAIEQMNNATSSGAITNSQIGVANGVASLDENAKIPVSQLDISSLIKNDLTTTDTGYVLDASQGNAIRLELVELEELINQVKTSLQQTFEQNMDALPKIHFNDTVDDSIGKDGDILLVPIS